MSDVYLSSIEIQNFRTFGDFRVALPATPGLLLLTGTNGLGKSSFFDGIEWALTGIIRRFTPYVSRSGKIVIPDADYLTRNGAERDSHSVTLQFSEDEPVRRSAKEIPSATLVSSLLSKPGRGQITDLGTHLAMTHFLGQAERQRFTSREADDQWAALKGPSGVDRLELIRTRLRGRPTTLAFGNRIKSEQAAIAAIEKDIADWQGWQARLDRLRLAVRASGGLSEEEVRSRAAALEAEIHRIAALGPVSSLGESGSQLLARLAGLLESSQAQAQDRLTKLASAEDLIGRYEAQAAFTPDDHPSLVRARQQLAAARTSNIDAQQRLATASEAATAQAGIVAIIDADIARLEANRADLARRDGLLLQITTARSELDVQNAALVEQRRQLGEADAIVAAHATAAAEAARLLAIATKARTDLDTSTRLVELAADAAAKDVVLSAAVAAAAEVRSEYDTSVQQRDTLMAALQALRRDLAEAERHASAIAAAVASVASHIHEDDDTCPVCQSHFPPGQLRLLANEAARSGNARVASIAERVESLSSEAAALSGRIADLAPILAQPGKLEPEAQQARQRAVALGDTLRQALNAGEADDLAALASARHSAAQFELRSAQVGLAEQQPVALAAEQQRSTASGEIERLASRIAAAETRLASFQAEERDCGERIAARGLTTSALDELGTLLATRRNELQQARDKMDELDGLSATARADSSSLQEQLGTREGELAAAELAQRNALAAAQQLAMQWTAFGLTGVPDRAKLESGRNEARSASTELTLLDERLKELTAVNQDLLLEEELAVVKDQMRAAGGEQALADPGAHLQELQKRLTPAREGHRSFTEQEPTIGGRGAAFFDPRHCERRYQSTA
ncbi:AAA family ATPase [Rhizobium sp. F40D2]